LTTYIARFVVRLATRRAALSSLFPYTTLFRSSELLAPSAEVGAGRAAPLGGARPSVVVIDRLLRRAGDHIGLGLASRSSIRATKDRKSTRLNSSHVSISYAVFCLKQKKRATRV